MLLPFLSVCLNYPIDQELYAFADWPSFDRVDFGYIRASMWVNFLPRWIDQRCLRIPRILQLIIDF